jgi:cytochrome oxidase Cu insertion factor (SCO1/SenC/PrrC family)
MERCLVSPMPNRMSRIVLSAVVCALFSLVAQPTAQQSSPQPTLSDVQKLGPPIGSRVPDFTLLDQKGQSRTLASLTGPKGLMLVFFRSADW